MNGNPDRRAELLATLEAFRDASKAADDAATHAARQAKQAELDLLEFDGKGSSPRARWLRAWLGGDYAACDHLLDVRYPEQALVSRPATPEEQAALRAEAERMNGATP